MKLRKLLALAIAAAIVVSLTACGRSAGSSSSDEDTSSSQDSSSSKDDDDSKKDDDDDSKKDDKDSNQNDQIVGNWDCDEYEISMVLDSDGRFAMSNGESTVSGSYEADGKKITLVADEYKDEPLSGRYDSSNGIIILSDDEDEVEFRKVRKPSYMPDEEEKPFNDRSQMLGDWYCADQGISLTIRADGTFSSSTGTADLEGTYEIDGMNITLESGGEFEYGTYNPATDELAFEPSNAVFTR